jgi:Replication initiator protein, pSAM2
VLLIGSRSTIVAIAMSPARERVRCVLGGLPRRRLAARVSGLRGGKGVPQTVAEHPLVFATFTAPSFGPVHTIR